MGVLIYYLAFVIFPIAFWLIFFTREGRSDPEPRKLLILTFLLGIGLAVFGSGAELALATIFFSGQSVDALISTNGELTLVAALILGGGAVVEEFLKYFALKEFFYSDKHFNQIADGIIYGVTLALGFVLVENSGYFVALYLTQPTDVFIATAIMRGLFTALLHITSAGIIGYSLGKKKFSPQHSKWIVMTGVLAAISLHVSFNLLISITYGVLIAIPLVVTAFVFLIILLKKPETKTIWRLASPEEIKQIQIARYPTSQIGPNLR